MTILLTIWLTTGSLLSILWYVLEKPANESSSKLVLIAVVIGFVGFPLWLGYAIMVNLAELTRCTKIQELLRKLK